MNSLSYALLAMLARKPCSGYELAKMMEVFWQAKHSQIYPLLSKLEEQSYLTAENVEQTGKPNKKIYSITETGKEILRKWLPRLPALPVTRDEFLIKAYAISLTDPMTFKRLIDNRIEHYKNLNEARIEKIHDIHERNGGVPEFGHVEFGRYIVHQRKLQMEQEEITWCSWVLEILGNTY